MCKGLKMCKEVVIILVLVPLSLNSLVPLERFDVLCIHIVCTRCRLLTFGSSVRMSAFQCVCTICVLQSLLCKPYQYWWLEDGCVKPLDLAMRITSIKLQVYNNETEQLVW